MPSALRRSAFAAWHCSSTQPSSLVRCIFAEQASGLSLRPVYRGILSTNTFRCSELAYKTTSKSSLRRRSQLCRYDPRAPTGLARVPVVRCQSHLCNASRCATRQSAGSTFDSPSFRRAPQRDETPRADRAPQTPAAAIAAATARAPAVTNNHVRLRGI